jgi:transcription antitermination protein NusB
MNNQNLSPNPKDIGKGQAGKDAAAPVKGAKPKSARRRSREFALQGLYQWLVSGEDAGAIDAHVRGFEGWDKADKPHFDALFHGVIQEKSDLDDLLVPLVDRPTSELSPVEHAALLLGVYELKHHAEIPYRVVINENVELAKVFGGTDGFRYVNGVLDKIAMKLRATELSMKA